MKIAFFAESPADQAALEILTKSILGLPVETVTHGGLRHRGWPAIKNALSAVLKQLHYHTEADGLVLIADANGSPFHDATRCVTDTEKVCRLCQLQLISKRALQQVKPRAGRPPLKVAIGLPVPAIEAWLLCGVEPGVNEAAWRNGIAEGREPYSKETLKYKVYGTSRPSLELETKKMMEAAARLASNLDALEKAISVWLWHASPGLEKLVTLSV